MKKILSVLSTISVITPTVVTNMAVKSLDNGNLEKANYSLEGFKNIVKILNQKDNHSQNLENEDVDALLDAIVPDYYFNSINGKEGRVLVWNSVPQSDNKIVKTYSNTYVNDSPFDQKRLTQSREEEVTESHSFSISLSENIVFGIESKIEGSLSVPLGETKQSIGFKFEASVGSKQEWSESTKTTTKEIIPSQEIIQSAHSVLHVKYIISQGTTKYDGIAQFKVDNFKEKVFKIPLFHFDAQGDFDYISWNKYSTEEILKTLKDFGYKEQLMVENTSEYSIISVDNIDNPKNVFVNLPISWSSEDSGIRLEHHEEKI